MIHRTIRAVVISLALAIASIASASQIIDGRTPFSFLQDGRVAPTIPSICDPTTCQGYIFPSLPAVGIPPIIVGSMTTLGFTVSSSPINLNDPGSGSKWGCWYPANIGASLTQVGFAGSPTAAGTVTVPTWSTASLASRNPAVNYSAPGAINTSAGLTPSVVAANLWRGSSAGMGGFFWSTSFRLTPVQATMRLMIGIRNNSAGKNTATDPSADAVDAAYIGCDAADTNLSVCANDNAGTAACTTLGASFPCKTLNAHYSVWIWGAPNEAAIHYGIVRHDVAASSFGTFPDTSGLPRNNILHQWIEWVNTGSTAAVAGFDMIATCLVFNP